MRALLALALLACCPAAAAADRLPPERLRVVSEVNYPPYLFAGEDGSLQGITVERWALWSKQTGIEVRIEGMEWTAAQRATLDGTVDVVDPFSYSAARAQRYEYSRPYAPVEARIYFHRELTGINDLASLRGFRVGIKAGSSCAAYLAQHGVEGFATYATSEALVRAAGAHEVHLFCMDAPVARYFLAKLGLTAEFRQATLLFATQYHWALAKGRTELRDFIQAGFDRIDAAELARVDARWTGEALRAPLDSALLYWGAGVAIALVLLASLLVLWNRMLQREVAARIAEAGEAHAQLQLIADSVPVRLAHWSRDMRCRWANARYADYYGLTPETVVGKSMRELIGDAFFETIRPRLERVLAGESQLYEASPPGAQGDAHTFEVSLMPERGPGGEVLGWFGALSDITERKSAEEALRKSEARFATLFHESPAPLSLIGLGDRRFRDINQSQLDLIGYSREEVIGRTSAQLGSARDTAEREPLYDLLRRDGRVTGYELVSRTRRGELRTALVSGRIVELAGERCVLWSFSDVTELRAAQSRIEELNASLEAKVEARTAELKSSQEALLQSEKLAALGRLVAGVAHELNTPIGNALLAASTAREHVEDFTRTAASGQLRRSELAEYAARAREASEILYRNLDRAGELIRSFKQVAADQTSSQRRSFALKEVVDEVLLAHHPILRKSPIAVAADVPESIRLDSYPGPLGQVLGNLIVNALLHGFEGRSEGRITVSARVDGADTIEIAVRDDGCGISEADQKMIFEPFFTTKLGRGGTGLGLAICHRLVTESLGGTLRVTSRLGQGTAFLVRIPVKAPAVAQREAA